MITKKNIKPLIGSVLIALILWFLVSTEREYTHTIQVPIEIVRLAPGKTLANDIPDIAVLELQGKGRSLITLNFYDSRFRLELPEVEISRKIELQNHLNFLDLPATLNLEVVQIIEPKIISLEVDDYVEVMKPLSFDGNVNTEDGYILIESGFSRDSVLVKGPEKLVEQTIEIQTQPLVRRGINASFEERLDLRNPHPELLELSWESVDVRFDIQRLTERIVYDIPITVINTPTDLEVEPVPPRLALRVKGGENVVASVGKEDFRAEIDFRKNYNPEKEEYAARIETPENITWIESVPKKFRFKVRRK